MKKKDDIKINLHEFEKQRYSAIKKGKEYAELKIIVSDKLDDLDGREGIMPCVSLSRKNCSPIAMAALYSTLCVLQEDFKTNFPLEYELAKSLFDVHTHGFLHHTKNEESEE